ncbi:MAG: glutamate--tRNA ligase [Candidatus Nealsonbacteria bacterium CG23_combo_of_CG06-09_8_20_14_all_36_12]|uniref:Glutamate--tRNA ligase n=1 Tax=Candidatus Nealsonbacteria bacterium CG23_combo_of_CG06-09_8_20_14_all_36_12 TaxID=1974718 RepID=A0A2G9Z015_9BACT|nr:MAG: glutamate--tRNA ligase [Candidatus Nealsonbacteria bacterium CG23_combo_of_CG06-09_8_20_14_all_36_12]
MPDKNPKSAVLEPEVKPAEILVGQKAPSEVRVRIAPAPTGYLHIGTARAALFNYLFAKNQEGVFVLRIEDTDKERSKPEFEKDILDSLKWLGIEWDEGPRTEAEFQTGQARDWGEYGPYRQSERGKIYQKYIEKLLDEGKAYHCFCSKEELVAWKQYQLSRGETPKYSGKCKNLSKEEVERNLKEGKPFIIRFNVLAKKIIFNDLIRGKLTFDSSLIGDFTIAKKLPDSSLSPFFVLAGTIDDFEMKISHVIRGEDHLSNTPKQILLQEALGFPTPKYGHLPLILGSDRSKLSKRHGAVAISEYKKLGYLPEALVNFMAFLGWNPGINREIYSLRSLIKEFSLERVQKGAAVFNIRRLDWINGFYIRNTLIEKLTQSCLPYLIEAGFLKSHEEVEKFHLGEPHFEIIETKEVIDFTTLEKIITLYQERLKKLSEISELSDFFFKEKLKYDKELLRWPASKGGEARPNEGRQQMTDKEIKESLNKLEKLLNKIKKEDWTKENLERQIMPEAEKIGPPVGETMDRGYLLWPFRVALTGKEASAGPFEIGEILGKEKTLKRIKEAKKMF